MLEQLWTWIQHNADGLTAIANVLMLLIWLLYLELFFRQYRRARRPYLEIQHGQGSDMTSVCLLVNVGKELFDVKSVIVEVAGDGKRASFQVSDYRCISQEDEGVAQILRQGPLQPRGLIVIGRFEDLIRGRTTDPDGRRVALQLGIPSQDAESIEIRCVALHSGRLVGARRRFFVRDRENHRAIRPEGNYTRQLTSRWRRNQLERWLGEAVGDHARVR